MQLLCALQKAIMFCYLHNPQGSAAFIMFDPLSQLSKEHKRTWVEPGPGSKLERRQQRERCKGTAVHEGTKWCYDLYFCSLIPGACLSGQQHLHLTEQKRTQA